MVQPQLPEYLYDVSWGDGADPTRIEDNGNLDRNGEPDGELGLVLQKDFDWQEQTGAPRDVQPGNIPGGPRDVLRGADFNNGQAEGFTPDSGLWEVRNGGFEVRPTQFGGDAVSVFFVDKFLPSYFELQATVSARKVGSSASGGDANNANAFLIFDYQGPTDFKFAGISVKRDKLQMGHRDASGWRVDVEAGMQLRPDTPYNMLLALNGTTATLLVDGTTFLSHTFAPRVDADGFRYGLNAGMVGIGADNSVGRIDNVRVQQLPPQITLEETETFADGVAQRFGRQATGAWQVAGERFLGAPAAGEDLATNLVDLGLPDGLQSNSILDLEVTLNTQKMGGVVFDQYGPQDFKFVALRADTDQVIVGHHTRRGGWSYDAVASRAIQAGTDYSVSVALRGTSVSVTVDGALVTGHAFNAPVVDGGFGLLTALGGSSFDKVTFRTNDPSAQPMVEVAGLQAIDQTWTQWNSLESSFIADSTVLGGAEEEGSLWLASADTVASGSTETLVTAAEDGGTNGTRRTPGASLDLRSLDGWLVALDRPGTKVPASRDGSLRERSPEDRDRPALLDLASAADEPLPADLSRDWLVEFRRPRGGQE
jgi:hypothetical protein